MSREQTQYGGDIEGPESTVSRSGPEGPRPLSSSEQLRLGYVTGQTEDVDVPIDLAHFKGGGMS